MLEPWSNRPKELRSLFNPAFCAALIAVSVKSYEGERANGMPLLAAYLLLPIALHSSTRNVIPATTRTRLTSWVGLAPHIHIGLAERIAGFRAITAESIRFAVAGGILSLSERGELKHVPRKPRNLAHAIRASTETAACFKVAKNLGVWFARSPDTTFLFSLFRIRP